MSTTIVGNLTRDPELRFTPGGMPVTDFSVAENQRRKNKQTNEYEDVPSFFDVVVFGDMAEHIAESLVKGTRVIVTGQFTQRSWETKDGEKRSKYELLADEVAPSLRWAVAAVTKKGTKSSAERHSERPF